MAGAIFRDTENHRKGLRTASMAFASNARVRHCMHFEPANAISLSIWRLVKRNADESALLCHLKTWRPTGLLTAFRVASCDLSQGKRKQWLSH